MQKHCLLQLVIVACTFIVALVMEIAPWPSDFQHFKPAWLVLVLLYWTLAVPTKISIGSAFVLGVVWDLVLGSILGVHALVLSLVIYLVAVNHLILRNLSLWMQSLFVVAFIFCIRIGIFLIELFLHSASFNWQEIYGALASGLLWPWVFLLLRRIRRQLQLR